MSTLNDKKRKVTAIRGMGAAMVGFAGWIILYIVFGLIEPNIFKSNNMLNLLRSMAKYLLVGVGQGVILITGNIDLSIGSVVAMSAMISATMMSKGISAIIAIAAAIVCCLVVGVINGLLVGKFKLPPFIATLGTMFCARGVAYMANGNRNTDAIVLTEASCIVLRHPDVHFRLIGSLDDTAVEAPDTGNDSSTDAPI